VVSWYCKVVVVFPEEWGSCYSCLESGVMFVWVSYDVRVGVGVMLIVDGVDDGIGVLVVEVHVRDVVYAAGFGGWGSALVWRVVYTLHGYGIQWRIWVG
jgi:hypothetical protein